MFVFMPLIYFAVSIYLLFLLKHNQLFTRAARICFYVLPVLTMSDTFNLVYIVNYKILSNDLQFSNYKQHLAEHKSTKFS